MNLNPKLYRFFTQDQLMSYLAGLLAICMITTPFIVQPILTDKGPTWLGLDVSWQMTLSYARMHHWTWGKDFIYTYGPLAFFSTRVGIGISKWVFVIFDLLISLNFFFVFRDFLRNAVDKFLAITLVAGICLLVNPYFGADLSWLLLFFTIYWMIKTYYDQRYAYFVPLILLTVVMFYVKMNTGLIAIIFLLLHLANLWFSKKLTKKKLLYLLVIFILLIVISSFVLHVSIFDYIRGSFEIIKGYNDIMYLNEDHQHVEHNLYILLYCMLLLFFVRLFLVIKEKKYWQILFVVAGIVYIFLLQKQSVLRNDVQHLFEFYAFAPIILLCGQHFENIKHEKIYLKSSLLIILFALFIVTENRTIDVRVSNRLSSFIEYTNQSKDYRPMTFGSQKEKRYIPKRILDKIGNKTVDIFPWDAAYALENKFNYTPRPVFQSFSAYTEELQNINEDFFAQKGAEFVIYDYDAIDNRYPFNDETPLNLFLANNYTVVDTFTSNERWRIVLERKQQIEKLKITRLEKEKFSIGNEISIGNASLLKINVQYNFLGLIKSIWHKPPPINIKFQKLDGSWVTYKTSKELLSAGVFVNKLIASNQDFSKFVTDGETLEPIRKVRLELDSNYFAKAGNVTFYKAVYHNDSNYITLGCKDIILTDPNQVFDMNGKKVIAIWGGDASLKPIVLSKGKYKITIISNGTPVSSIYPHMNIFVDNHMIGKWFTTDQFKEFSFNFEEEEDGDVPIRISMDNDAYNPANHEDRNAFIQHIYINKLGH